MREVGEIQQPFFIAVVHLDRSSNVGSGNTLDGHADYRGKGRADNANRGVGHWLHTTSPLPLSTLSGSESRHSRPQHTLGSTSLPDNVAHLVELVAQAEAGSANQVDYLNLEDEFAAKGEKDSTGASKKGVIGRLQLHT